MSPYVMGGRRMAQLAVRPAVVDFIDAAMSNNEVDFSILPPTLQPFPTDLA